MSTPSGLTGQAERRRWAPAADHQARPAWLADDGYTDQVTGCHNRRYLLEVLEPQMAISSRYGFPLAVVLAEVAGFRSFRFRLGDAAADHLLAEMAGILRSAVRASDLVVRYGEASFALLLLHADRYGAGVVCRRLMHAIDSHAFTVRESDLILVVNMGAADFQPPGSGTARELMAAAEAALEAANHAGHGAIVVSGTHP